MKDGRLTVRFNETFQGWIAELANDEAVAVRALMLLGAAQLGFPGAAREAQRLLQGDMAVRLEDALLLLADKRQTRGRHVADTDDLNDVSPVPTLDELELPEEPEETDPFASFGIEV